jgi:hypothetical protein
MARKAKRKPTPTATVKKAVPVPPSNAQAGKQVPKRLRGIAEIPGNDEDRPVWRLSLLDHEYNRDWSWRGIDGPTLLTIIDLLAQMERLSWKEIRAQITGGRRRGPKHKLIPVEHLCEAAQRRLVELELDDLAELFRFRTGNLGRLWGVISEESPRVFYPVWWDPLHKVCPSTDDR